MHYAFGLQIYGIFFNYKLLMKFILFKPFYSTAIAIGVEILFPEKKIGM